MPRPHFADDLIVRLRALGHPLCVGLDPHTDRIPELFRRGSMRPDDPRTAEAVGSFLGAVLDRLGGRVAVVKPQIAFFELLGPHGLQALAQVVREAKQCDLLVVLDAKRGDIGSTAAAYAAAYLGEDAAIPVDAMTLNPYLGRDSLQPFFREAARGRGLFVLVKTSNPGSADYQNLELSAAGHSLYEEVATTLVEEAESLRGERTGFSSLGVVVGATYPGESERVREILPHSIFLVPGYGAQGASAAEAVRGFVRGPDGRLEGGIVNSSRGILFPEGSQTNEAGKWEQAIDAAIDRAIEELGAACS